MKTRRDAFQAIADPTRRQIIDLLSRKSMNLNAVADQFDVSRPAISKHIKILYQCGLIQITEKGRERHCRANLDKLKEVSEWVERYRSFWNQRLDMLGEFLESDMDNEK
jgi:DNA-binding transcriptional ArsR family regulator